MKVLRLFIIGTFVSLFCIHTMATNGPANTKLNSTTKIEKVEIVIVEFNFNYNNCVYTVLVAFNTTNGEGAGQITQNCNGIKRTINFIIYGATVVRGITPANFTDFTENDVGVDVEMEIQELMAVGINENW